MSRNEVQNFLENVAEIPDSVKSSKSVLKEAAAYNVDLEDLEKVGSNSSLAVVSQVVDKESSEGVENRDNFEEIDIKLSDVIRKVFDPASRPYVIICDDKIEYMNKTALNMTGNSDYTAVLHHNFLEYVAKDDWNKLAENIGTLLTENSTIEFKMKSVSGKVTPVKMQAIYVPDSQHFSFLLVGVPEENTAVKPRNVINMFDSLTGLPNFYLFEDRVQVAVNNENYKDARQMHNMIAVVGVCIDNLHEFKQIKMEDFILKKLASRLVLGLPRYYTVAKGLKYHFWVMMNDITSYTELEVAIAKIRAMFDEPVTDNFTEHYVHASIGCSVFPKPAQSAKKLIEQVLMAVQEAQNQSNVPYVMYKTHKK